MTGNVDRPPPAERRLIALDWGTTTLRAGLMSESGAVLKRVATPDGIMAAAGRSFADIFAEVVRPWLDAYPDAQALACGMIGSRQGWVEARYLQCPAGLAGLSGALAWTDAAGRRVGFVPGLSWDDTDVMRGEETQLAGALSLLGVDSGVFVLPGTHSKWAVVESGQVTAFRTFMTGEMFAVLRRHSILGKLMTDGPPGEEGKLDEAAFDAGCHRAAEGAVLHSLFSTRVEGLFGRLAPEALPSYLSGLLVGEEVREALALAPTGTVNLVCSRALAAPYRRALSIAGVKTVIVFGDVAFAGLHAVAHAAGLI